MEHTPMYDRQLSDFEIEKINEINTKAKEVAKMLTDLLWFTYREGDILKVDSRWLEIGRTHLQEGFMAVIRSIARPETF